MSLSLASDIWDALRDHIDLSDRSEAADILVNLLIDLNYEVEDIKDSFRDKDISSALKDYNDEHSVDNDEEDYEDNDDDDGEW